MVNAYYDIEENTLYCYGDSDLARYGAAAQIYSDGTVTDIWMLEKYSLYLQLSTTTDYLRMAGMDDAKVVYVYVSNGKRDSYKDYHIAEVGDFSDAPNIPSFYYSITIENCKNYSVDPEVTTVYDYFFGETEVVDYKRLPQQLR